MVRVNINGTIFEDKNIIQIKNGFLIVGEENLRVIGYECIINTIDGVVTREDSTTVWKPAN